jgi:predicted MFS family arabinose efflux permease
VARLAPPGRRDAYQGGWALVSSLAMGSALALSSQLTAAAGWRGAWLAYAALALAAALGLSLLRQRFANALR